MVTCTKFQLEILTISVISEIVYFREIILESSRNVSETTLWHSEIFQNVFDCIKFMKTIYAQNDDKERSFDDIIDEADTPGTAP